MSLDEVLLVFELKNDGEEYEKLLGDVGVNILGKTREESELQSENERSKEKRRG